jgi:hypothetical protein
MRALNQPKRRSRHFCAAFPNPCEDKNAEVLAAIFPVFAILAL